MDHESKMRVNLLLFGLILLAVQGSAFSPKDANLLRWRREVNGSLPASASASASASDGGVNWAGRLRRDLLPTYDRQTRPAQGGATTNVTVDLTLKHVHLDELTSTFTAYGWIKLAWQDSRLRWNASEYGGVEILHLADHEVWQPDITLYNSASGTTVDHYGNTLALVYSTGAVLWVPPTALSAFCALDLRNWPRDEHECALKLGSWTYDATKIDLIQADPPHPSDLNEDAGGQGGSWAVTRVRASRSERTYSCCVEPYVDLTYYVKTSRRGRALLAALLSPAAALALLLLTTPLLPPASRATPLLATCLAAVLFLVHFARSLPAMADHTPHIVTGYCGLVWVACFWAATSAAVANLLRQRGPAPQALRRVVLARACALLVPPPSAAPQDEQPPPDQDKANADGTWMRAAAAFDRLSTLAGVVALAVLLVRAAL